MPREVEEIIFGGLLGDFNLQTQTNGKTWRLRLMTSNKHIDYINHLKEVFKPWIRFSKKAIYEFHKVQQRNYIKWYINTLVTNDLNKFGDWYYVLMKRRT